MSEPYFRPVSKLARTSRIVSFALSMVCGCQSTSTEPSATTAEAITVATAAVTSAAVPSTSAAETAPSPAASEAAAGPNEATPAKPSEKKPGAKAASGDSSKDDEPAKDTVKPPQPALEAPKPEAPVVERPCLATSFKFAAVRSACEKGGVPKAKALMKAWTNKAKEKGESYKCATCHDDQKTYTNKPSADADLRKMLDVIK